MIDSGAEMSLCKPGIAKTILKCREMTAKGFDGHTSDTREVRDVIANIQIENLMFNNVTIYRMGLVKEKI